MLRTHFRGPARLAAMASLASAAGAAAQCDWYVQKVPDFDQRRQQTSSVPGLPGDGGMYCVPTSTLNWCAYIANHGYPAACGGVHKWSNQANYDLVTSRDLVMGSFMGTTVADGTGGSGWLFGGQTYFNLFVPGKFDITVTGASGGYSPTTGDLWISHLLGGLVCVSYGRYIESPANHFTRDGGHIMSLVGVKDLCAETPTLLQFRDPASDGTNTTQSPFATTDPLPVVPVAAHYRGNDTDSYDSRTEWRFTTFGTPSFVDGYCVIWPRHGLTSGGGTDVPETVRVLRPVQLVGSVLPAVQDFATPTGGTIRDLAMNARFTKYFYITGPVGATPTKIFGLDPSTGQSTEVSGFVNPMRLCFGRQGQLYVLDGATILVVYPDLPPGSVGPPTVNSLGIEAMTYDDATDKLVGFDSGRHAVYLWNANFAGDPVSMTYAPPCVGGRVSLAISPADGSLWMCSRSCDAIYKIVGNPTVGLSTADTITLPAGSSPAGLNVTRQGHVLFSSFGIMHEMEQDANGAWIDSPGSDFAGQAGGVAFCLSRSRTNFDSTMVPPGYSNLLDPEVIHGTPDCYANCDGSTVQPVLNVNDFACFLNEFASGDPEANCDDSTVQPVLNVNDFACFLNKFANGCPG